MARIVYKPMCSNCGSVIEKEVRYKEIDLLSNPFETILGRNSITVITPYKCEKCGAFFDCIEIRPPRKGDEE